jgi:hypothetical protein
VQNDPGQPSFQVKDYPHDPSRFDLWSFGPNMVNEWGGGDDDIASWGESSKR